MCLWYEWMVSSMWMCLQVNGWGNGQRMEWLRLCCTGSVQYRLETELFSVTMRHIIIYCNKSGWQGRQEREQKRHKTGIKSFRLEDYFQLWLAWMDKKDTNNKQLTMHIPTTWQMPTLLSGSAHLHYNTDSHPPAAPAEVWVVVDARVDHLLLRHHLLVTGFCCCHLTAVPAVTWQCHYFWCHILKRLRHANVRAGTL